MAHIKEQFFLKSWMYAPIFLALGFVLDILLGHTIFQRFGALIVGYAVLHVILGDTIAGRQKYFQTLEANGVFRQFSDIPDSTSVTEGRLSSKGAQQLSNFISNFKPNPDLNAATAASVPFQALIHLLELRDDQPVLDAKSNTLRRNEWALAIAGTLIWAFGDWVTNLVYHCPGRFECN